MPVIKKKYAPLAIKGAPCALCQDLLVGSIPIESMVQTNNQEINSVNANDTSKYNIYWD